MTIKLERSEYETIVAALSKQVCKSNTRQVNCPACKTCMLRLPGAHCVLRKLKRLTFKGIKK